MKNDIWKSEQVNPAALQEVLWTTLCDVRSGSIEVDAAKAIAACAREICSVARIELQNKVVSKMLGEEEVINIRPLDDQTKRVIRRRRREEE